MSGPPPRVLTLCADDFGLATGISMGIAQLARARRLNAVSCIVTTECWPTDVIMLRSLADEVELGLHFNLTDGVPLSRSLARLWPRLPSARRLLALAHLRLLPLAALRAEFHAQIAAFIDATGRAPRFVDGHEHVHHLPGLRDIVLDATEHLQPLPAMRSTARVLGPAHDVRRWLIERSGGRGLGRELRARHLPHNAALLGVYDFRQPDYGALMRRWLALLPPQGGLLFCHPGEPSSLGSADPIAEARERELDYLDSDAFLRDLTAAGVVLGPVWHSEPLPPGPAIAPVVPLGLPSRGHRQAP